MVASGCRRAGRRTGADQVAIGSWPSDHLVARSWTDRPPELATSSLGGGQVTSWSWTGDASALAILLFGGGQVTLWSWPHRCLEVDRSPSGGGHFALWSWTDRLLPLATSSSGVGQVTLWSWPHRCLELAISRSGGGQIAFRRWAAGTGAVVRPGGRRRPGGLLVAAVLGVRARWVAAPCATAPGWRRLPPAGAVAAVWPPLTPWQTPWQAPCQGHASCRGHGVAFAGALAGSLGGALLRPLPRRSAPCGPDRCPPGGTSRCLRRARRRSAPSGAWLEQSTSGHVAAQEWTAPGGPPAAGRRPLGGPGPRSPRPAEPGGTGGDPPQRSGGGEGGALTPRSVSEEGGQIREGVGAERKPPYG